MKRDDLLYFVQDDGSQRLCIPRTLYEDIFHEYHDAQGHLGIIRVYHQIREGYYMHSLHKWLRDYILHYPKCNTHQTKRHKPYGSLRPVRTEPTPFHTICIDFMVGLPESSKANTTYMSVTYKFTKRIGLIPGKATDTAEV
jgi:hypothetical protein